MMYYKEVVTRNSSQSGQMVVILLLVMVLALAIGLSIVGRSITEISNSTKSEQSSRAFLAAEAGIEKALRESQSQLVGAIDSVPLSNEAGANVDWTSAPSLGVALEHPPVGKESFVQFWLADPQVDFSGPLNQLCGEGLICRDSSFDIFFGKTQDYTTAVDDQPALEVNIIFKSSSGYQSEKFFYDSNSERSSGNGFQICNLNPGSIATSMGLSRFFYCRASVSYSLTGDWVPLMVRVRILYSNISHPVALNPNFGYGLPTQATVFNSSGAAGNITRKLQVFRQQAVMPQLFDYALFSAGDLRKE